MPKLVVSANGQGLGEFPVNKDRMVIGSKASNEIHLDGVNADAEHAAITRCGDLYVIEDLGSAQGTVVHERKITKLLLSDEDLISIGSCQLRFVEDDIRRIDAGVPAARMPRPEPSPQAPRLKRPRPSPVAKGVPLAKNQCPHCSYLRQAKDVKVPEGRCPSCGLGYATAPGILMSAESKSGDRLEVYDKEVVIKRKMGIKVLLQSLKGDLLEGIKGDKFIPIDSIASVQFKPASTLLSGYITIVLPESKLGFKLAGLDDYTVEFVKREEAKFLEIKAFLDAKIS